MLAFWINYGCLLHVSGDAIYIIPLCMQGLPAILLLCSQFFCNESPRWLCRQDRWEEASATLSLVRGLPVDHPYVAGEISEIYEQLEHERRLVGGATFKVLMREMWTIPGNRKRALISVGLMICQQMTGTNVSGKGYQFAVVCESSLSETLLTPSTVCFVGDQLLYASASSTMASRVGINTDSTQTHPKSSRISGSAAAHPASSQLASMVSSR